MAGERFIDFDVARAERRREPVVVRVYGRDWTLHEAMPAGPVLDLARMYAENEGAEISGAALVDFAAKMVPADVLQAWLSEGMSIDELGDLLRLVVAAYRGGDPEEKEAGDGPPADSPGSLSPGR